jgi:hypothetical protein
MEPDTPVEKDPVDKDIAIAVESDLVPKLAHSRIRFLLRAVTFYLLTGLPVTGVCCGVPVEFCTTESDAVRPRWWRTEAKRGVSEVETFLRSADRT